MKIQVKVTYKYYKRVRQGEEPIRYVARQPKGVGTNVFATIYLDPILKKHPDLLKALLKHELNEIKAWGMGKAGVHTKARVREPALTRKIGGVSGFWKEIKRRESKTGRR